MVCAAAVRGDDDFGKFPLNGLDCLTVVNLFLISVNGTLDRLTKLTTTLSISNSRLAC